MNFLILDIFGRSAIHRCARPLAARRPHAAELPRSALDHDQFCGWARFEVILEAETLIKSSSPLGEGYRTPNQGTTIHLESA
jgi:hypothetical protein